MIADRTTTVSDIRNYCKFPPEWSTHLDKGHPYQTIRGHINQDMQRVYDIPTELIPDETVEDNK